MKNDGNQGKFQYALEDKIQKNECYDSITLIDIGVFVDIL